jgi:hypothetical protein
VGNTNEDLWIAAQQSGSSRYDGDIDEIRVTSAALDPSWFIQMGASVVSSPVSLVGITVGNGSFSFGFSTVNNHSYVVQSSPALGAGAVWMDVQTVPGDGTVKTVSYDTTGPQLFYRVRAN